MREECVSGMWERRREKVFSGASKNSQKRVHDAHGYDDPAHPHVHGRQLGRLLRLLVDAVVHEAEGELRDDEDEQQDADHLVGAVELFGLREMMCAVSITPVRGLPFRSSSTVDTTSRRKIRTGLPYCKSSWYERRGRNRR